MTRRPIFLIASLIVGVAAVVGLLSWWFLHSSTSQPSARTALAAATAALGMTAPGPTPTPVFDATAAVQTLGARRTDAPTETPIVVGSPAPGSITYATPGPGSTPGSTPVTVPTVAPYASPTPENRMFPNLQKDQIIAQLAATWASYKTRFIENSGRVIDPTADNITTSEGQSYALLRAVWQNDRATFDHVLNWTRSNLQGLSSGKLFAYKWGQDKATGTWKALDQATASDADCDIALALTFAARLWNEPKYSTLALQVLNSIWDYEVVQVQGVPYLTAGDWTAGKTNLPLNPSYLSPAWMRIFAVVDPAHDWKGLVDSSYKVILGCTNAALDTNATAKLPPNWCGLNRQTGQLGFPQDYPRLDTAYGYDAFRTMWRVALDYQWFGERRAYDYLNSSDTLRLKYRQTGKLFAVYDHAGNQLQTQEDLAVYSGDLAYFWLADPLSANDIVDRKLLPTYNQYQNQAGWGDLSNYYTQNWVWFGLALYAGQLPNIAGVAPAVAPISTQDATQATAPDPTATVGAGLGH